MLNIRSGQKIETRVYKKSANTDIYINWNSSATSTWNTEDVDHESIQD